MDETNENLNTIIITMRKQITKQEQLNYANVCE